MAVSKKYIITWEAEGNEGMESHYRIADEYNLIDRLNELTERKGAWGNTGFHCYELGEEIPIEITTVVKVKGFTGR